MQHIKSFVHFVLLGTQKPSNDQVVDRFHMFSYVPILFSDIDKISHLSLSLRPMKRDHCWVLRSLSIQWQWPHKKAVESDFEYRHSIATVWRFIAILFLIGLTQLGKTLGIVFFAMVAHALGFLLPVGRAGSVMPCIL